VLSLAYLPGRDAVHLHGTLRLLASDTRSVVAPLLVATLLVAAVVLGRRSVNRSAGS
jgi:hypothetical protein